LAVGGESGHPIRHIEQGRNQMARLRHGESGPATDGDQCQGCSDHHQKDATTHSATLFAVIHHLDAFGA
jgi:hypothetical protein